jgi:hypothetical protein
MSVLSSLGMQAVCSAASFLPLALGPSFYVGATHASPSSRHSTVTKKGEACLAPTIRILISDLQPSALSLQPLFP